jgi:CRP-like cAMP-binding protein
VQVYKITREKFEELGFRDKLHFPKRNAVGGAVSRAAFGNVDTKPPSPKTPEQVQFIAQSIQNNINLSTLFTLSESVVLSMVEHMWREEVKADDNVVEEGDPVADYFYVIDSGSFKVMQGEQELSAELDRTTGHTLNRPSAQTLYSKKSRRSLSSKSSGEQRVVATLGRGKSFGAVALLCNAPRNATVRATENSVVWVLDRVNFQKVLHSSHEERRQANARYLDQIPSCSFLLDDEKQAIAKTFVDHIFYKGDQIFWVGDTRDYMVILYNGDVEVSSEGKRSYVLSTKGTRQDTTTCFPCAPCRREGKKAGPLFFGEKALAADEDVTESVVVTSNAAHGLVLERAAFELLLSKRLADLRQDRSHGQCQSAVIDVNKRLEAQSAQVSQDSVADEGIPFGRLTVLGLLGCGGFGFVELCEDAQSKRTFALISQLNSPDIQFCAVC